MKAALLCCLLPCFASALVPNVELGNSRGTAVPGLLMPAIGLGTGAYSNNAAVGYGGCEYNKLSRCPKLAPH